MGEISETRFPLVTNSQHAGAWLHIQSLLGLAHNTVEAYGRALEDYLGFCQKLGVQAEQGTREHIALYVHDMATRPNKQRQAKAHADRVNGLSNATMQQRLTALRLYYDYLVEEQVREINPVGRGHYTPGKAFGGARDRGLIPHYSKLPWIPTEEQWQAILQVTRSDTIRNRMMFALAYDAGLRREELCALDSSDIDPAHKRIRVRAETTKNRQGRVLPYSPATGELYAAYLQHRRGLSRARGPLFLAESRRNTAQPLTIWTWSKVVHNIAQRAGIPEFTTHTLRHLCLTDLARAGWDIHEIAQFAGHRTLQSTLLYIHLSGHDLAERMARSLNTIRLYHLETIEVLLS